MSCGCYCSDHLHPVRKCKQKTNWWVRRHTAWHPKSISCAAVQTWPQCLWLQKEKRIHPQVMTVGFPLWRECVLASKVKVKVKSLSHVWLFVTPWTVAYQAPPSMGFSRQEYWSGLPFPCPVDHVLSELSTMTPLSWLALTAWLSVSLS